MIDKEVMMTKEEQRGRVEVTTLLKVKDPSDPLDVNPSSSFKNLVINDPKDIEMSDQGITDHNDNSTHSSKTKGMVEPVTKANLGSNTSHSAEPLSPIQTSAADVNRKEKEKKETDSETEEEEEVEEAKVEEEEVEVEAKEEVVDTDEVEIIDEVSGKEAEVEEVVKRRKEKKGASGDGDPWGTTDRRIKEVKAQV